MNFEIVMSLNEKNHMVEKIYQNIIKISRSKFFYIKYNLDDSFETRFDLIILHSFIIFYFYKINSNQQSNISQNHRNLRYFARLAH